MEKNLKETGHLHIMLVIIITSIVSISSVLIYQFIQESKDNVTPIKTGEEHVVEYDDLKKFDEEDNQVDEAKMKEETEKKEEEVVDKELEIKEDPILKSELKLTSKTKDNGIHLYWTTQNLNITNGVKIVKSLESNPTFPEDGYIYVEDSETTNYFLNIADGKKWYIRVCKYDGAGSCSFYSNEIYFEAPYSKETKSDDKDSNVDEIKLEVIKKSDSKVKLEWDVEGKAEKGFKVVWSKNSKPTYPTRDGDKFHYISKSSARSYYIGDLDSGKRYYFRVCEYLGSKCGTYSNEESIKL